MLKLRLNKSGLILSLSLPFPLCSVVRDLSHFSSPTLMSPFLKNLVPVHKRDKASDVSPLWTFIAQNSKRSGSLSWNFHGMHSSGQSGPSQGLFVFPHLQVLTEMSLSSFEGEKKKFSPEKCVKCYRWNICSHVKQCLLIGLLFEIWSVPVKPVLPLVGFGILII